MEPEPEIPAENFKVFADKTRISILNTLNERKYTTSELSRTLNLSKPTILHHLKILENAGYVRRVDDGRKWIYYELTDSGKFLVRWRKVKVILPVIGVIAATITAITAILFKPEKEIPEYPAMGADLTWLLVLIVISMFTVSLVVIYLLKRARFKKS